MKMNSSYLPILHPTACHLGKIPNNPVFFLRAPLIYMLFIYPKNITFKLDELDCFDMDFHVFCQRGWPQGWTFLHCVFSNVSSNRQLGRRQSHTGCTCSISPHCVFSNVSSNCLSKRMHSCTGCICSTSTHCVFLNGSSNCLPKGKRIHIDCIC